jgi:hypothetical protein
VDFIDSLSRYAIDQYRHTNFSSIVFLHFLQIRDLQDMVHYQEPIINFLSKNPNNNNLTVIFETTLHIRVLLAVLMWSGMIPHLALLH